MPEIDKNWVGIFNRKVKTEFNYNDLTSGDMVEVLPESRFESEFDGVDPSAIDLRVSLDKKQRKGKAVTLITGFGDLHIDDLKDLAKTLKSKCGVGGAAKDGEIIIQGDHVQKVIGLLRDEGFKVKRTGG